MGSLGGHGGAIGTHEDAMGSPWGTYMIHVRVA